MNNTAKKIKITSIEFKNNIPKEVVNPNTRIHKAYKRKYDKDMVTQIANLINLKEKTVIDYLRRGFNVYYKDMLEKIMPEHKFKYLDQPPRKIVKNNKPYVIWGVNNKKTAIDILSDKLGKTRNQVIHYFYTGFPIKYKDTVDKYCSYVKYV